MKEIDYFRSLVRLVKDTANHVDVENYKLAMYSLGCLVENLNQHVQILSEEENDTDSDQDEDDTDLALDNECENLFHELMDSIKKQVLKRKCNG